MFFTVSDQNYHAMQSGSSVTRLVLIGQPGKSKRRPIKSAQIGHKVHQNCLSPTSDLNRRLRQARDRRARPCTRNIFFLSFFFFLVLSLKSNGEITSYSYPVLSTFENLNGCFPLSTNGAHQDPPKYSKMAQFESCGAIDPFQAIIERRVIIG